MKKKSLIMIGGLLLFSVTILKAQEEKNTFGQWNVKSNLLYDATGTINIGTEFPLSSKWSLDVSGNYNGWTFSNNKKWKHWMLQPELRAWSRSIYQGHFFSLHTLGGEYNLGHVHFPFGLFKELRTRRHEGWYLGGGVGYGYRWNISRSWGVEAQAAVGYIHFNYRVFECATCGDYLGKDVRNYIGPTKLAINLIYIIK